MHETNYAGVEELRFLMAAKRFCWSFRETCNDYFVTSRSRFALVVLGLVRIRLVLVCCERSAGHGG